MVLLIPLQFLLKIVVFFLLEALFFFWTKKKKKKNNKKGKKKKRGVFFSPQTKLKKPFFCHFIDYRTWICFDAYLLSYSYVVPVAVSGGAQRQKKKLPKFALVLG